MERRRAYTILIALFVLVLVTTACSDSGGYSGQAAYITSTPRLPSARELAAVETAQAEETREAMANDARGTAEVLANQRQATQQALDLNATQRAQEAEATAWAWEFSQTQETANVRATAAAEARIATATRQSIDATTTAEHDQATATAVQWAANVQGTKAAADAFAVESTRRAVERADEREATTQKVRAWVGWALLALAIPLVIWLGWRAWQTIEARGRVIRRKADEGEPFVMLEQDGSGNKRIALPLRSFSALMDTGDVPALPAPEHQEAATMRQQTANAIQARQVAATVKARKAHKRKPPQIAVQPARALPSRTQTRRKRRQIPGIVKVVAAGSLEDAATQGVIPPQLVEAIEGQWHEVDGED
jgi:hypothetical protein